jgi:hypothetical protein
MENRFKGLIESFIVIAILLLVYWTLGFVLKKLFIKRTTNNNKNNNS